MSSDHPTGMPVCEPTFSARGLVSMFGALLVMLPLYVAAIWWFARVFGWHWRWTPGIYLGAVSVVAGLCLLVAVGWRRGEGRALGRT